MAAAGHKGRKSSGMGKREQLESLMALKEIKKRALFLVEECTPSNSELPRVPGEFCSPCLIVSVDSHAFPEPRTSALGQDESC